jgi:hypothetical protein
VSCNMPVRPMGCPQSGQDPAEVSLWTVTDSWREEGEDRKKSDAGGGRACVFAVLCVVAGLWGRGRRATGGPVADQLLKRRDGQVMNTTTSHTLQLSAEISQRYAAGQ